MGWSRSSQFWLDLILFGNLSANCLECNATQCNAMHCNIMMKKNSLTNLIKCAYSANNLNHSTKYHSQK